MKRRTSTLLVGVSLLIGTHGSAHAVYVGGNPVNYVDPLGLETAYVYNGPTFPTGNNPFGHTAIATTGAGVYSFGNSTALGSSLTAYLFAQSKLRETAVVILPTTPDQEAAMLDYLRRFTHSDAGINYWETCAARTAKALSAADLLRETFIASPQTYGFPYSQYRAVGSLPGARTLLIPKGGPIPPFLSTFDPR